MNIELKTTMKKRYTQSPKGISLTAVFARAGVPLGKVSSLRDGLGGRSEIPEQYKQALLDAARAEASRFLAEMEEALK